MNNKKCALITGASRGIGKTIALQLHKDGYSLVLNSRTWNDEKEQFLKENNCDYILSEGDVSSFEYANELVNLAKDSFGSIDVVVNNAGITKDNLIIKMTEQDFDDVIDINLKGTFNILKAVSKIMIKQRQGKIINISSIVGIRGNAGQVNYSASKGGIISMTKSLAKELAGRNILVNAIAPGFIQTDMTNVLSENVVETIKSQIPLKRLGTPEDIANIVSFLASDKSSYITGQVFSVDGGMNI